MGWRAILESEENRKRRVDPQAFGVPQAPSWQQGQVDRAMAIQSGGAEEARNQGQRAADVISQGRIAQGQAVGQGLQNLGEGYMRGADMATRRASAEEQMAQSRQQRELTGLQTEGEKQRLAALPGQLQQQQELTGAQIGQAKSQQELMQLQAQAAMALSEFENSSAVERKLPDAQPDETVRQYELRMKSVQAQRQLEVLEAQKTQLLQEISQSADLHPKNLEQIVANIESNRLNNKMAQFDLNDKFQARNIRTVTALLSPYGNDVQGFMSKQKELIQDGVPEAEVFEAANAVMSQQMTRAMQQQVLNQAGPMWRHYERALDKSVQYRQALSQLQQLEKSIGNASIFPDPKSEQDAIEAVAAQLEMLGMTHSAEGIRKPMTVQGMTLVSRKTLIKQSLQELQKRFDADMRNSMPSGLGWASAMPSVRQTYQQFGDAQFINSIQPQEGGDPGIFSGMGNLDFSKIGAPK